MLNIYNENKNYYKSADFMLWTEFASLTFAILDT